MDFYETIAKEAATRWHARENIREENKLKLQKEGVVAVESAERIQMRLNRLSTAATKEKTFKTASSLAATFGQASPTSFLIESFGFERVIGKSDFLGTDFLELALAVSRFVCRIQIRNSPGRTLGYGTGFMVSPRLLITNNHVLSSAQEAVNSEVEFDYQKDRYGRRLPVVRYGLEPQTFFMTDRNLDFTIVAVRERSVNGIELKRFGWNRLIAEQGKVILGDTLNIVQHPQGEAKQIVLRSNRLVDILDDFAYYETDTEPISSGSPVYNDQWEVVALHHSGVPKTEGGNLIAKDGSIWRNGMDPNDLAWLANEGVRISSIVNFVKKQRIPANWEPLRDELLHKEPPHPFEAAAMAYIPQNTPTSFEHNTTLPTTDNSYSFTIPLHITVQVGIPQGTPSISSATNQASFVSPSSSISSGVDSASAKVLDNESSNNQQDSIVLREALRKLEVSRNDPYYEEQPSSSKITEGSNEVSSTENSSISASKEQQLDEVKTQTEGKAIPDFAPTTIHKEEFVPLLLEKTVIALPLFKEFEKNSGKMQDEPVYAVIIDINLLYEAGREGAKKQVQKLIFEILKDPTFIKNAKANQGINPVKTKYSQQYVFAVLEEGVIKELVRRDCIQNEGKKEESMLSGLQAIYHIWPDFEIRKLTTKSGSTVKADAARNAFSAYGEDIFWAVMDSGIDGKHPHFTIQKNLELLPAPDPLQHRDFTVLSNELSINEDIKTEIDMTVSPNEKPLEDDFGHGTHVAGIIAGELKKTESQAIIATTLERDESNNIIRKEKNIEPGISGMAPKCKLVSLKVLDREGRGQTSNLIAAIQWIQEINGYGRRIRIQGLNMSIGYEFDPEWFACGQSPLCVEVNRLVKSGVVVVVAAGNTGYGYVQAQGKVHAVTAGIALTINDPGNADLAITVGSTHREMPHVYGVSYFSSKGPTGDGRLKPDLVAPGEKIISCDSTQRRVIDLQAETREEPTSTVQQKDILNEGVKLEVGYYKENSGTSMAAPHVSGVIAAFLSARREFIGSPEAVKKIFTSTATDLKREKYFQGHGLVDLMRAIQSV